VQAKRIINQTISLLLATMLLMVAGGKSWSEHGGSIQQQTQKARPASKAISHEKSASVPADQQAAISALSLDAVITPAISFDFSHYFYFAPLPIWQFIESHQLIEVDFRESFFLFSCFNRVFARCIVTNAP
jgi:hypothetical protein